MTAYAQDENMTKAFRLRIVSSSHCRDLYLIRDILYRNPNYYGIIPNKAVAKKNQFKRLEELITIRRLMKPEIMVNDIFIMIATIETSKGLNGKKPKFLETVQDFSVEDQRAFMFPTDVVNDTLKDLITSKKAFYEKEYGVPLDYEKAYVKLYVFHPLNTDEEIKDF